MEIHGVVDWCTSIPLDTPLARLATAGSRPGFPGDARLDLTDLYVFPKPGDAAAGAGAESRLDRQTHGAMSWSRR
jgi:hypothetical protein